MMGAVYLIETLRKYQLTVIREHKPPPRPKCQLKVIRDLNPDFRINKLGLIRIRIPNPDVYWIIPKMLRIITLPASFR